MQDGGVAGFPDIGGGPEDQPQGIVVESAAHVKVAAPGERLVLMIGAAIGKLRGREIHKALPRALRNHVHKAQQVLR